MGRSIVLADSFLESFDRLDRKSRRIIRNQLSDFSKDEKGKGFQVHDLKRTNCDPTFKSARMNRDLRLIFSQQGSKYILLYVGHHDDAYNWVEGKFLEKNNFGSLYVHDKNIDVINDQQAKYETDFIDSFQQPTPSLLKNVNVSEDDLIKLGLSKIHAEFLLTITNEDQFIEYITIFNQELQEALLDIVSGTKTIDQVYAELVDEKLNGKNLTIEESLQHKDSKRRFYVLENVEELDYILQDNFERWKLFLHPEQELLVRGNFNGPVLIEGGPGTGKTVVGIHRAVYLAKHLYPRNNNGKILFCTFSVKLASYIEDKIQQLVKQKNVEDNIVTIGIDKLIFDLIRDYGLPNGTLDVERVHEILRETYEEFQQDFPFYFYFMEYKEVIQKFNITSLDEYLKIDRRGRGVALNPAQRRKVWEFFSEFFKRKRNENVIDFEDRAIIVLNALENKVIPPLYDSIIVDEAQDLSPVKLRLLYLLTKRKKNNFMILSDQNQRIYTLNSWRHDVSIDIVGRTYYLSLNYRTTKQIREYADKQFYYSDMMKAHIRNYKSLFMGPEPVVENFANHKSQFNYIVDKLKAYIDKGYEPHEIAIISPNNHGHIAGVLEYEGIPHVILEKDIFPKKGLGVNISTLHGCKGLEFRVVFLMNYSDIGMDLFQNDYEEWYVNEQLKQLECLKYVASTRAREELYITYVSS